jgi:hypothetical protein
MKLACYVDLSYSMSTWKNHGPMGPRSEILNMATIDFRVSAMLSGASRT